MSLDVQKRALNWLANGRTGISSKSICFEFLGVEYKERHPPLDPADLNRCLVFLMLVPEARSAVDSLAEKCVKWKKAADVWDAITESFAAEIGIGWPDHSKSAPLTYNMMKAAGL